MHIAWYLYIPVQRLLIYIYIYVPIFIHPFQAKLGTSPVILISFRLGRIYTHTYIYIYILGGVSWYLLVSLYSLYSQGYRLNIYSRWGSLVSACILVFSVQLGVQTIYIYSRWGSLVSACILVFSVQLGVQTLPFLLSGELFPTDVRATCKVKMLNL